MATGSSSSKDKYDPLDVLLYDNNIKKQETSNTTSTTMSLAPKIFGSTQESKTKTVTVIRNDDSESTNSDTEFMKEAKERNLKNLKRKAITSRSRKQQDLSTTDSDTDDDHAEDAVYDRNFKMSSSSSASSTVSNVLAAVDQHQNTLVGSVEAMAAQSQSDQMSSSTRPPKRKKSRWGPDPPPNDDNDNNDHLSLGLPSVTSTNTTTSSSSVTTSALTTASISSSSSATATAAAAIVTVTKQPIIMLSTVTRSDPALLQYAKQNFGTINLSEEDWQKAEEHYKVNLLFQDMQRKRQELDFLAKNNKFKYEYDSDEDVNGGSWEHKMRSQEMEATLKWAEALNKQCEGRHHIGDFLPPEEFKKFMEKYDAQKNARQPDISDYKEYKLKEDNIGYQLLQKLGWKEGTALGASGSGGITEPINKYGTINTFTKLKLDQLRIFF